jgi:dodecin
MDAAGEFVSYTEYRVMDVCWGRLSLPETHSNQKRSHTMSVAKVSEIIASSPKSFDDAIKVGVARAHKTLKNLKSAWVENQQVKLDDNGQILEYRVQLKVTFVLED